VARHALDGDLAAARLWATNRCPYLAAALFALSPIWREGIGTFATDARWRLYLDPVCFERWSIEEAGAVLVHEAHHLLRDHSGRAEILGVTIQQHERFNVAADLEINDDLTELPLPGGLHPEQFGLPTSELAEMYFDALSGVAYADAWECGSGAHGGAAPWDDTSTEVDGVSAAESELIRQAVATEVRAHQASRGDVGAGLAKWAEAFLEPVVDWRRVLAGAIRASVVSIAGAVDFSYARPSRRSWSVDTPRVVLPSLRQPVPRVAVVVDTSGSMSAHHLEAAMAELAGVLKLVGAGGDYVTVLCCDSAVRTADRIFGTPSVNLVGGGGTNMGVGIDAAVELRPTPDVILVLTDGLTPWPPRSPRQRVVVVLVGELGDGPPWAQQVRVPLPTSGGSNHHLVPASASKGGGDG
jgi:predicted metal-dependent peptidase